MSTTTKKPLRRVGVGAQYMCFGDPMNNTPYEEVIIKNETVTSIDTNDGGSPTNIYASNKIYDVDKSGEAPVLEVENVAFDPIDLARAKGERVEGAFTISGQQDEGEHFAYGVVYPKKGGNFRFVWYPRCVLTASTDSAKTMDDGGPNTQNPKSTIQTLPFNDAGEIRVAYDTDMAPDGGTALTETEFFAEVLTAPIPEG